LIVQEMPVAVRVAVADAVRVAVTVGVAVAVAVPVAVALGVGTGVSVDALIGVGVSVAVAVAVLSGIRMGTVVAGTWSTAAFWNATGRYRRVGTCALPEALSAASDHIVTAPRTTQEAKAAIRTGVRAAASRTIRRTTTSPRARVCGATVAPCAVAEQEDDRRSGRLAVYQPADACVARSREQRPG
jgi:hypothetical protein